MEFADLEGKDRLCGAFTNVTVGIQHGDLFSEGGRDELVQRNAVVLRERLRAAAKRFGNVDVERTHDAERMVRNSSGVTARICRASKP